MYVSRVLVDLLLLSLFCFTYQINTTENDSNEIQIGVCIVRFKTIPILFEYLWNESDS